MPAKYLVKTARLAAALMLFADISAASAEGAIGVAMHEELYCASSDSLAAQLESARDARYDGPMIKGCGVLPTPSYFIVDPATATAVRERPGLYIYRVHIIRRDGSSQEVYIGLYDDPD